MPKCLFVPILGMLFFSGTLVRKMTIALGGSVHSDKLSVQRGPDLSSMFIRLPGLNMETGKQTP